MLQHRILLLILVLIAGLPPVASAQRGGSGPRGDEYGNSPGFGGGPRAENRLDRFADTLKLNRQQKNAAKETFDAAQQEAAPIRDQIQKSRVDIAEAVLNNKTPQEVDELLTAHGKLAAQMTAIEIHAFAKVFAGLNDDQRKRSAQALAMMTGMFSTRNWNGN